MKPRLTKKYLEDQRKRLDLRGIFNEFCNATHCLADGPRWFHREHESYYCAKCASIFNRDEPGICVEHRAPLKV